MWKLLSFCSFCHLVTQSSQNQVWCRNQLELSSIAHQTLAWQHLKHECLGGSRNETEEQFSITMWGLTPPQLTTLEHVTESMISHHCICKENKTRQIQRLLDLAKCPCYWRMHLGQATVPLGHWHVEPLHCGKMLSTWLALQNLAFPMLQQYA